MSLRRVNLLPPGRRDARRTSSRARRWAAGIGGACGLVILAQLAPGPALAEAEIALEIRRVGAVSGADRLRTETTELRRRLTDTRKRITDASLMSDRPDWSIVLAFLASRIGDHLTLDSCRIEPDAAKGYRISASGRATAQGEVTRFVLALEEPGIFDAVELVQSKREENEGREAVRFEIACILSNKPGGTP